MSDDPNASTSAPPEGEGPSAPIGEPEEYRVQRRVPWWGWALIVGAVLLLLLVIPAVLMVPTFNQARGASQEANCRSNLKQIGLALQMYMQDWDERTPPAKTWGDGAMPYIRNQGVFRCPSGAAILSGGYGYAYNSWLSGRSLSEVVSPTTLGMAFESRDGRWNAADQFTSFVTRHRSKGNVCYFDGHVRAEETAPPAVGEESTSSPLGHGEPGR